MRPHSHTHTLSSGTFQITAGQVFSGTEHAHTEMVHIFILSGKCMCENKNTVGMMEEKS